MARAERELLSFDDAQILRLESDAIKGHTGKMLVIAPAADGDALGAEELRRRIGGRIGSLKRLRQRVEVPSRGRPCWVDVDEVDLGWHVREVSADGPLDDEALRATIGRLLAEKLDHERPLWRLDLVPLTDGATAIVGRIHHAMADGVTAISLTGSLLWDEAEAGTPPHSQDTPAAPPAPADPAGGDLGGKAPGRVRRILKASGALRRELTPAADSPLDRHIGPEREVAHARFGLKRLKAIEHAAGKGITVNDVVLATVAGGLRRWLNGGEGVPDRIRVQVPVCLHLRTAGADQVGNRDSFLNVDLPLHEPDPALRLRRINQETSERKLEHDAETLYSFFHAVGRFRPIYQGVTRITSGPREFALSVSNVPGPRRRPTVLGRSITDFVSFAEPADRHALRVSVVSLGGELAFGLCSDPNAIGGLDRLAAAFEESVAELEQAVREGQR